jgi:DNA repair exonuclease SbcCD ATPase subunit
MINNHDQVTKFFFFLNFSLLINFYFLELFSETNPELAYYKSSLESERNRRKQLETLIDVQQQRLSEAESELIQLRANDHKKTLCMKQLEQMIPNVVDEWKEKENDYKTKLNNLTQQIKQIEQTNREKIFNDKHQFDEQINEKNLIIERLTKDNERIKQDYESIQSKTKQYEQRIQQLTKDSEQVKKNKFLLLFIYFVKHDLKGVLKYIRVKICIHRL